ncbi:hypothetical protein BJ170DRAFT_679423 [Xylariales sp. AK1849]|nr:hypothetical protein BJ170DRAFT_679423 [Xylariales sp. AK1849]
MLTPDEDSPNVRKVLDGTMVAHDHTHKPALPTWQQRILHVRLRALRRFEMTKRYGLDTANGAKGQHFFRKPKGWDLYWTRIRAEIALEQHMWNHRLKHKSERDKMSAEDRLAVTAGTECDWSAGRSAGARTPDGQWDGPQVRELMSSYEPQIRDRIERVAIPIGAVDHGAPANPQVGALLAAAADDEDVKTTLAIFNACEQMGIDFDSILETISLLPDGDSAVHIKHFTERGQWEIAFAKIGRDMRELERVTPAHLVDVVRKRMKKVIGEDCIVDPDFPGDYTKLMPRSAMVRRRMGYARLKTVKPQSGERGIPDSQPRSGPLRDPEPKTSSKELRAPEWKKLPLREGRVPEPNVQSQVPPLV